MKEKESKKEDIPPRPRPLVVLLVLFFPVSSIAILLAFHAPTDGLNNLLALIGTPAGLIWLSLVITEYLRRGLKRIGVLISFKGYVTLYIGVSIISAYIFPVLFLLSSASRDFGKLYYYTNTMTTLSFFIFLATVSLGGLEIPPGGTKDAKN